MQNEDSPPLYELLNQIVGAAQNGYHLLALSMAVALPDICVSLSSEDGRSTGERYKEWCKKNLPSSQFNFVTGEDLWSMRCGVLHNGRFGDLKHNVARVLFSLPGGVSFTNCKLNDAYIYGVLEFCKNICDAAYNWYGQNDKDPIILNNSKKMMRYHLNGFPPYTVGMPVIG